MYINALSHSVLIRVGTLLFHAPFHCVIVNLSSDDTVLLHPFVPLERLCKILFIIIGYHVTIVSILHNEIP